MERDDEELCGAETTDGTPCENPAESCPWHDPNTEPDTRKTNLEKDPSLIDKVADRLASKDTVAEACSEVPGISEDQYYEWRRRADEDGGVFSKFRKETTRARRGAGRRDREELKDEVREQGDTRTWFKLHMKQYGDTYGDEDTDMRDGPQIILHDESTDYLESVEQ